MDISSKANRPFMNDKILPIKRIEKIAKSDDDVKVSLFTIEFDF